ncbi:hypothetical protein GNZ12_24030 [Paraburkholderia sp. 1N]|uniref:LemA family protein n=1 Tax=Paraburkholderia solitsugae TaxID=2675748 RepID=A0ABX2BXM9_9BURK|nr:hypothetical protein [Paraburkholderia solitsugae]
MGWAATHFFSEARERRKEVRAALDKILVSLEELRKKAFAFHESAAFSEHEAQELQTAIYRLNRLFARVPILDPVEVAPFVKALRQSITLLNFSKSTFVAQVAGSEVLENISDACSNLEDEFDRQYAMHYPHGFPYILPGFVVRNRDEILSRWNAAKATLRGR